MELDGRNMPTCCSWRARSDAVLNFGVWCAIAPSGSMRHASVPFVLSCSFHSASGVYRRIDSTLGKQSMPNSPRNGASIVIIAAGFLPPQLET